MIWGGHRRHRSDDFEDAAHRCLIQKAKLWHTIQGTSIGNHRKKFVDKRGTGEALSSVVVAAVAVAVFLFSLCHSARGLVA